MSQKVKHLLCSMLRTRNMLFCSSTVVALFLFYQLVSTRNHKDCSKKGIVTVVLGGRLGNQIYEYAAVWAVARKTGLLPYVPRRMLETLENTFKNLSILPLEEVWDCPVDEKNFVSLENWNNSSSQNILLPKYVQYPEIIMNWIEDIRQEFTFNEKLRYRSQEILRPYKRKVNKTPTLIGVHVRRTDFVQILKKYHIPMASTKFYFKAMKYFEAKYHNAIFIIASDDPRWCQKTFSKKSNAFVMSKANSPELDLAILSACNHTIFDYGTYGQWAALLAGGNAVFFKAYNSSITIAETLKGWHGMK